MTDCLRVFRELYSIQLNLQTEILSKSPNRYGVILTLRHRFYQAGILCAELSMTADVIPQPNYDEVQMKHADIVVKKVKQSFGT